MTTVHHRNSNILIMKMRFHPIQRKFEHENITFKMDALTLMIVLVVYTVLFVGFVICMFLGWIDVKGSIYVSYIANFVASCFSKIVPRRLQQWMNDLTTYIFYKRNPVIQILYATLLIFGYGSYTETVFPHVSESFTGQLPYYLLVVNLAFFAACGCANPGVITKDNIEKYLKDFEYDGTMYVPKDCSTCLIKKPARSKHCAVCDMCISRFDHHCSWVNACIGKYNYRYFLGFLLTLVIICGVSSFMTVMVFLNIVETRNLHLVQYSDEYGHVYEASLRTIMQFLATSYPLMSVLLVFLVCLFMVIICFYLFHLYLVLTNKTTNELCSKQSNKTANSNSKKGDKAKKRTASLFSGWYSKGILSNISEVLFPS